MDGWQFGPAQELRRAFVLDDTKLNCLDRLLDDIEQRYGDAIDWTTLGRLATSLSASSPALRREETATRPVTHCAA